MSARALRSLIPILALTCACDASWQGAPGAEFPAPYAIALVGPEAPFNGPVTITATPDPPDGTLEVRFAVDGALADIDVTAPYAFTLDLTQAWGGPRHVTAIALRTDGTTAEASIDVTYDPLSPFVTVLAPAAGTRIAADGGTIEAAFLANDPFGIGAAAVQIDGEASIPLPLASLAISVPVPAATSLPAARTLSWWIDDRTGNRTAGSVPFVQTHERFDMSISGAAVFSLPGERFAVFTDSALRVHEADGSVAWTREAGTSTLTMGFPTKGGDIVTGVALSRFSSTPDFLERRRPDGSLAWRWPTLDGALIVDVHYLAANDSLVALRWANGGTTADVVLVDAAGIENQITSFPAFASVTLAATPDLAAPAGFAVSTSSIMSDPVPVDVTVFDISGAPAWTCQLPSPATFSMLTRDALLTASFGDASVQRDIVGPGGLVNSLGFLATSVIAPNGDVIVNGPAPADPTTLSRVRPDGSIAWQVPLGMSIEEVVMLGDRVSVSTGSRIRVIDAAGDIVEWSLGPHEDLYVPHQPRAVLTSSGAFYVVDRDGFTQARIHRAGPDGVTVWREIYPGIPNMLVPVVAGDERLLLSIHDTQQRLRVFAP
ncbi:MAG: hypothetical protein QM820_11230 [Minicystis sp.]